MQIDQHFSSSKISALMDKADKKNIDLVIINGRIPGAKFAIDAVLKEKQVLLVEEKSAEKLSFVTITGHGLPDMKIKRQRIKSIRRRKKQYENHLRTATPHVIRQTVLFPVYKQNPIKVFALRVKAVLFDILTFTQHENRTRWINKRELINRYSFIEQKRLNGALLFYEFKTNKNRWYVDSFKKANKEGVVVLLNMNVSISRENESSAQKILIQEPSSEKVIHFDGKQLNPKHKKRAGTINQQKADKVLSLKDEIWCGVIKRSRLPVKEAFRIQSNESIVDVIPDINHVFINARKEKAENLGKHQKAEKLIQTLNQNFPALELTVKDLNSFWLEKVQHNTKDKTLSIYEIFSGYNNSNPYNPASATGCYQISGCEWENTPSVRKLKEIAEEKFDQIKETNTPFQLFEEIFYRYAKNTDILMERAYEQINKYDIPEKLWLDAEVWYGVNYEHTDSISGFFLQQTQKLLTHPEFVSEYETFVLDLMAELLNWDEKEKSRQQAFFSEEREKYRI